MDGPFSLLVIAVIVAIAVAIGIAVSRNRRRREQQDRQQTPAARKDPFADVHGNEQALFALKVGDMISYHHRDWWVRGTLRFDESGFSWTEHLISDFETQQWLSVEEDEGIEVALWERIRPGEVTGDAGDTTVTYDGEVFTLVERGEAAFTAEGTTGTSESGTARYVDYESANGRLFGFEQLGSEWEASVGRRVLPAALDIYPVSE